MPANNPGTVKIYDLNLERVVAEIPSSELSSEYTRFSPPGIDGAVFAKFDDHKRTRTKVTT